MKLTGYLMLITAIVVVMFTAVVVHQPAHNTSDANTAKIAKSVRAVKKSYVKKERKFEIRLLNIEETGALSRKITAQLINRDGYAKNVTVTVVLLLDNGIIKINGKKALKIDVGNMKPNESVDKTAELSVSFFDGLRIKSKGYVDIKLIIKWDKGKEILRRRIQL